MWWIIGIGIVAVIVIGVIVIMAKFSSGGGGYSGGGDTVTCPHCHKPTLEPPRRRTGADIDLYDFPCSKCGETIYVKAGGR